jgi:hypothetical protein
MKIKLLVSMASVLTIGALSFAAPALASPMFWTNATKTTPLRDLETSPKEHPDILEFANQRPVAFSATFPTGKVRVACNQVELGATVIINNGVDETTLSVPFGVFEGDQCVGPAGLVPTRFGTLAPGEGTGVVGNAHKTALITVTGSSAPFPATIHNVKVWQDFAGKFCAWNLDRIPGVIENTTEGFVEEAPPNLSVKFPTVEVPITNPPHSTGCPKAGTFSADFLFLETMSTATDTAVIG